MSESKEKKKGYYNAAVLLKQVEKDWDYETLTEEAKRNLRRSMGIPESQLISPTRFTMPECETFQRADGSTVMRFKTPPVPPIFAKPVLDNLGRAFIPGIENSRPSEDPEIRIKVRKHKLKFNFNN